MVTEKKPVVKTGSGKVMGETREGVAIFRGIPYGGDCGPGRRFMAPVPAESWEGVRDCTKNGPIAVQLGESVAASAAFREYFGGGHPELQGVLEEEQGENCLVLNVLTPDLTGKRPVLFYIHGGGFTTNSGSIAPAATAGPGAGPGAGQRQPPVKRLRGSCTWAILTQSIRIPETRGCLTWSWHLNGYSGISRLSAATRTR